MLKSIQNSSLKLLTERERMDHMFVWGSRMLGASMHVANMCVQYSQAAGDSRNDRGALLQGALLRCMLQRHAGPPQAVPQLLLSNPAAE